METSITWPLTLDEIGLVKDIITTVWMNVEEAKTDIQNGYALKWLENLVVVIREHLISTPHGQYCGISIRQFHGPPYFGKNQMAPHFSLKTKWPPHILLKTKWLPIFL